MDQTADKLVEHLLNLAADAWAQGNVARATTWARRAWTYNHETTTRDAPQDQRCPRCGLRHPHQ